MKNIWIVALLLLSTVGDSFSQRINYRPDEQPILAPILSDEEHIQNTLHDLVQGVQNRQLIKTVKAFADDVDLRSSRSVKSDPMVAELFGIDSISISVVGNEASVRCFISYQGTLKGKHETLKLVRSRGVWRISGSSFLINMVSEFLSSVQFKALQGQAVKTGVTPSKTNPTTLLSQHSGRNQLNSSGSVSTLVSSTRALIRRFVPYTNVWSITRSVTVQNLQKKLLANPVDAEIVKLAEPSEYIAMIIDDAWNRIVWGSLSGGWVKSVDHVGEFMFGKLVAFDLDAHGNIYCVDGVKRVIVKLNYDLPSQSLIYVSQFQSEEIPNPVDVDIDNNNTPSILNDDSFWVVDNQSSAIVQFSQSGQVLGRAIKAVDDLTSTILEFSSPSKILVFHDYTRNVSIIDLDKRRIITVNSPSFQGDALHGYVSSTEFSPSTNVLLSSLGVNSGYGHPLLAVDKNNGMIHTFDVNNHSNGGYLSSISILGDGQTQWVTPSAIASTATSGGTYQTFDLLTLDEWSDLKGMNVYLPGAELLNPYTEDFDWTFLDPTLWGTLVGATFPTDCKLKVDLFKADGSFLRTKLDGSTVVPASRSGVAVTSNDVGNPIGIFRAQMSVLPSQNDSYGSYQQSWLVNDVTFTMPLKGTISGPTSAPPNSLATYQAGITSGSGDFTYQWYADDTPLGTDPSQAISVGNSSIIVRCELLDNFSGQTATTSTLVTILLSAPTLASPANNVTNVVTAPTLTWNTLTGAASYQVQVSKTNSFGASDILFDQSNLTTPSFAVPGLVTNTTFYWRVRGKNAGGDGAWSETRNFKTSTQVTVNTVWSGTVAIQGGIVITNSATLTITAGTTLLFGSGTMLRPNGGTLNVSGTSSNPVIVDGQNFLPSSWGWALVSVEASGSATFNYAEFRNAKNQLIYSNCTGNLTVTNCTFTGKGSNYNPDARYADGYAIMVYGNYEPPVINVGSINIGNNVFTPAPGYEGKGSAIYLWNINSPSLNVSNNIISNWFAGVFTVGGGPGTVSDGFINNCAYGVYSELVSPAFTGISMSGNSYPFYLFNTSLGTPVISGCTVTTTNQQYGIYAENARPIIRQNAFTCTSPPPFFHRAAIAINGGRATIEDNTITNYESGIDILPYLNYTVSQSFITGNTITNFIDGIRAWDQISGVTIRNNSLLQMRSDGTAINSYGIEIIENNLLDATGSTGSYGIRASGSYAPSSIKKNEVKGFYCAVWFHGPTTPLQYGEPYSHNNFRSNTMNVLNYSGYWPAMPYNWWGVCPMGYPGYPYGNLYGTMTNNVSFEPPLEVPELSTGPGGLFGGGPGCSGAIANNSNEDLKKETGAINLAQLPVEYSLKQNHPNPFNPSTVIRFDLPERSQVVLQIFDILGREVRRLVDQHQAAGAYSMTWNGLDNSGEPVTSGMYLCRVVAVPLEGNTKNQFVGIQKMILSK